MAKFALIITNGEYSDPGLTQLPAPGKDAVNLAHTLKDPKICAFDEVRVLITPLSASAMEAIDEFFDQKKPADLLVLYFAGHCIRDEFDSLYLAVKNTIRTRLRSTAIKSIYIREAMDQSRSKRQVVILDCCNSGAFPQGTKAETGGMMGMVNALQGYGRFVLTASDATQFAWEGDKIIGETQNSLFTHFLVKGLEGEADRNGDGRITVDELYDYAFDEISKLTPKQTPTKSISKQEGEIVLRQITRIESIKPIPLPDDLMSEIDDLRPYVREAAVQKLEKIIKGKNIGLARSAVAALEKISIDDNTTRRVAQMATEILESVRQAERKAAEERRAKEEAERLAALKAEEERLAREKAEAERKAKEEAEKLLRAQAEREGAERKAARLKAERGATEKAAREAAQKAQQEKVEKGAAEKAEREAMELASRKRAERQAAEKAEREALNLAARRKAEREESRKTHVNKTKSGAKRTKELETSIAYPKLLSKRFASSFLLQYYLPQQRAEVTRNVRAEFDNPKISEYRQPSFVKVGQKIRVKFFSHAFDFSEPVTKVMDQEVNIFRFLGTPKDNCGPGSHQILISISDDASGQELESITITAQVVDFAFDHISRPLLSRVSAIVLGIGSFSVFLLGFLEQIDKTVGFPSGTAVGFLAVLIYGNFYNLYQRIRPIKP